MRKTTDPHEHKYLIDREFNTFGRGAIEDAPAELLYGHGAVSKGYNVNCHNQYFEGRTGSRLFALADPLGLLVSAFFSDGAQVRKATGANMVTMSYVKVGSWEYGLELDFWRYVVWPDGSVDKIVPDSFHYVLPSGFPSQWYILYFNVESSATRNNGNSVPIASVTIRGEPGLPDLFAWHTLLKMWVRIDTGNLYHAELDMEWGEPVKNKDNKPFAKGRTSFIELWDGGVIYNGAGVFRWVYVTDKESGDVVIDEVFRIDHECPVKVPSHRKLIDGDRNHTYRYLVTAVKLRDSAISRLAGGIIDYETPASEHDFNFIGGTGLVCTPLPIGLGTDSTVQDKAYEITVWTTKAALPQPEVTHIAVYRTLDLGSYSDGKNDYEQRTLNSENSFALIGEYSIPNTAISPNIFFMIITDDVDDATLRSRMENWYPRTLYHMPFPSGVNVAALIPGWVLCAVEGESKLYYTTEASGAYTWGNYNGAHLNEQVRDGIYHIEAFPSVIAIFGAHSTWAFPLGVDGERNLALRLFHIPSVSVVDNTIGCTAPRTIQHLTSGEIILVVKDGEGVGVRTFNGHSYGENLLEDATLGLSRNKNRLRNMRGAIAAYNEASGYIVWVAVEGDGDDVASYCFRCAVRSSQGGGVTEYGGAQWLWPSVGAAAVAHGYDEFGNKITIVVDARTGNVYRIGLAEQWLDRETGADGKPGSGHGWFEIETRVALAAIADGYKWQKHLETHIAMRCWRSEYRISTSLNDRVSTDKNNGTIAIVPYEFTADGFRIGHKAGLKIYEDGEQIAEASELQDLNRNGDYAYIRKIEARRIQEVISTTTSCYKISRVVVKVQTSDREALPVDNRPVEIDHQREWRDAVIHLSRNLPYSTYNRADGTDMEVSEGAAVSASGAVAPNNKELEAFCVDDGWMFRELPAYVAGFAEEAGEYKGLRDFTLSSWVRLPRVDRDGIMFAFAVTDAVVDSAAPTGMSPHVVTLERRGTAVLCRYDGAEIIRAGVPSGEWVHLVLRRNIEMVEGERDDNGYPTYGMLEWFTLFVDGVKYLAVSVERAVQNVMVGGQTDVAGTFGTGISYQNTWEDTTAGDEHLGYVGSLFTLGHYRSADFFDVRLIVGVGGMVGAVSDESVYTYYNAVRRDDNAGEGWLP